jgi:hypothetical protein
MKQIFPDCMIGPSEPCAGFSYEQERLEKIIAHLRSEKAILMETLRPFSNASMDVPEGANDDSFVSNHGLGLTLGQLRHARAILGEMT